MAEKKKDNSNQVRLVKRKVAEGEDMLQNLMKQHQPLLDHLAARSKDDRTRQREGAGDYLKTMKVEDENELDLGSSQGESDNDDMNVTSDDSDGGGEKVAQSALVIDDKLQQRNKVFFEEADKIIEQTIRDYVER